MERIRMSDLAWPDYDRRVRDGAMVLVPVGALEQHGPHMSMNPDVLLPTAIAERVAGNVGGLVAPAIAYGYKSQQQSGGGNHMPGNTCLDGQTMISLVRDVLRELARHGVRRVVLVNGHYENSMFLTEGVDLAALSERFGLPREGLIDEGAHARLRGLGMMWADGARIGVAPAGRSLLDTLLAEVVADTLVAA